MGCHFLLQEIFLTRGLNGWVSRIVGGCFTFWATRKLLLNCNDPLTTAAQVCRNEKPLDLPFGRFKSVFKYYIKRIVIILLRKHLLASSCVWTLTKLPWRVCCLCFGCAGSSMRHEGFSGCGPRASLPRACGILVSQAGTQTSVPCIGRQVLKHWTVREVQVLLPFS